jgi:hypothetical protein
MTERPKKSVRVFLATPGDLVDERDVFYATL